MTPAHWMAIAMTVFGCYCFWLSVNGYKSGKTIYGKYSADEVTRISDPAKFWTQVIGHFIFGILGLVIGIGNLLGIIDSFS